MKRLLSLILVIVLVSNCEQGQEQLALENGVSLALAENRKARLSFINYKLDFRIPADVEQRIQGLEEVTFNLTGAEDDLQLDFRESKDKLQALTVNGKSKEILFENEHIILKAESLVEGFNKVEINFFAGETSLNRKEDYLYTLFVPDRARTAFPCFDQPNLKANFQLTLDIPQNWNAISNAPAGIARIEQGRKNITYEKSDLISTYLFSFVAGEFQAITQNSGGREFTLLHRETDKEKVERNRDFIFYLHAASLQWLEEYTGIKYPFKKLDFALIPAFQYGGMEHVGAIQYRASSLFLDEDPSQSRLLGRASLIAHEVAHMWFGNLVTMDWFNDVWTKEVFANFMAAKMVNPSFPEINHDLSFLTRHYPSAYGVDRTQGANPIRQELLNLNEAGQMYGAIIYNKAPIMMRQLELLLGEVSFQKGMQEYLNTYSNKNATWPNLINILDKQTPADLNTWSEVWVNTAGRPSFEFTSPTEANGFQSTIVQNDKKGDRNWPQVFRAKLYNDVKKDVKELQVLSADKPFEINMGADWSDYSTFLNSDGIGYGIYPASYELFQNKYESLTDLEKGALLVNYYENLIEPNNYQSNDQITPERYVEMLKWALVKEKNQLLIGQMLGQMGSVYWNLLTQEQREIMAPELERTLFHCMNDKHDDPSIKKQFFNTFRSVTITDTNKQRLFNIWKGELSVAGLRLSENDKISLASNLAIKLPDRAESIIKEQYEQIKNPDSKKRFAFIRPSLSNDIGKRDQFFESLGDEKNRETESWVLGALDNLHHPLRRPNSEKYIRPSLELLKEIQETGDIFFPKRWLDRTLGSYNSKSAVEIVDEFLEDNPDYNKQLGMKINQSIDMARRSSKIFEVLAKK